MQNFVKIQPLQNEEITLSFTDNGQSCPGLEVIKVEYSLRLKIKRNDWLHTDTSTQAANHCALFWVWELTQVL